MNAGGGERHSGQKERRQARIKLASVKDSAGGKY